MKPLLLLVGLCESLAWLFLCALLALCSVALSFYRYVLAAKKSR